MNHPFRKWAALLLLVLGGAVMGSRDPYTIVNLKGAYRINKNLKVSLAVDNAFNRKYFSGVYRAPSRSYFLEVAGAF